LPFVGRSGKLLDRMIAAIGLDRSKGLYRQRDSVAAARQPHADAAGNANLPAVHPAPDRTGEPRRAGDARQSLDTDLLSTREGIMRTRGKWFDYDTGTRTIRAIASFHPAYLLRSPSYKRMSWQDLRAIAKALENSSGN